MGKACDLRRAVAAAAVLAAAGLCACTPQPKARAFDTSFKTDDGYRLAVLAGGPEAAADHAQASSAEVNGFALTEDVAPAVGAQATAPASGPEATAADAAQGFQIVAAAPAAEIAPGAVARAMGEPVVEPAAAVAADQAAAVNPPTPVRRVRVVRKARPAARPLAAVALFETPANAPALHPATRVEAQAPEPARQPDGGGVMFAACVLAAGALWRWHQACLKGDAAQVGEAAPPRLLTAPAE